MIISIRTKLMKGTEWCVSNGHERSTERIDMNGVGKIPRTWIHWLMKVRFIVVFQIQSMTLFHNEFLHIIFPNFHGKDGKFTSRLEAKLITRCDQMSFEITQWFFRGWKYSGKDEEIGVVGLIVRFDWYGVCDDVLREGMEVHVYCEVMSGYVTCHKRYCYFRVNGVYNEMTVSC